MGVEIEEVTGEFTAVNCILCGKNNTRTLFVGQDYWYECEGHFTVCQCLECELIYQNPQPIPETINKYYPTNYAPFTPALHTLISPWRRWDIQRFLTKQITLVHKYTQPPGTVLDIGCATGNFLAEMRKAGWRVHGVELDDQAADYARTVQSLPVHTGTLFEADLPSNHFHLVTMWHVLEHVHNPVEILQEAARISHPNGHLIIAVPNPKSWEALIFGQYWAGWDLPRHLFIMDSEVIPKLLQKSGWEIMDSMTRFGRHWLFMLSVHHLLKGRIPNRKRWQQLILKIIGSLPVRLMLMPCFMLIERLQKGSILIVIAKRSKQF